MFVDKIILIFNNIYQVLTNNIALNTLGNKFISRLLLNDLKRKCRYAY